MNAQGKVPQCSCPCTEAWVRYLSPNPNILQGAQPAKKPSADAGSLQGRQAGNAGFRGGKTAFMAL